MADDCYTEIDLKIFRQYLAPALGITHRFVGNEPFCAVTAKYNRDMRYWLETPALPSPPIALVEIERLQYQGTAISASGCASCWRRGLPRRRAAGAAGHPVLPAGSANAAPGQGGPASF